MKAEKGFKRMWARLDWLLLVGVVVLLALVWYSAERKNTEPEVQAAVNGMGTVPEKKATPASRAVDALRVSTAQARINSIARSMIDKDWSECPRTPAMDMREDGTMYEILLALPEGVAQESVRVTTLGDVLTLTMRSSESGQPILKRVRLPCSVDRAEHVKSAISNNVLRVRIQSDDSPSP